MKITAFDDLYPSMLAGAGTVLDYASGSNTASGDVSGGGDVTGSPGDYSVVGLRRQVSLASNIGGTVAGDVLTIVQTSPRLAMFATPSNSGVSFGSNATRVSETASVGALATAAREDHIHDGIGTVTASSSNTMQRGTLNLRPGANVAFGLTDTDGDGEHDTLTINATAGGGGSGLTIEEVDGSPTDTATKLVLPNGTLSYAGSVATYTPTGGSAVYPFDTNYFAETKPGSPDATYDDEFDDTTGMSGAVNGLAAKWNWRNQGTTTATFTKAGWLTLTPPASATPSTRIIEIAAFADGTYETRISLEGVLSNVWQGGIVMVDSTNGDFHTFELAFVSPNIQILVQRYTNVTTYLSTQATQNNKVINGLWMRVVKSGTTLSFWASNDGIGWMRIHTMTDAVGADRIGLGVSENNNTGTTKMHVDYFRKVA